MEGENHLKKQKKRNRAHSKVDESNLIGNNETKEIKEEPKLDLHITNSLSESDSEEPKKKKKKKKKKPEVTTDNKSKNKSIRQAKKEKFVQRQAESQAAAKQQIKSECLNYLTQWKHNRQNWKFMKAKQVWLYKNKFSESLVPKESWPLLLEYFESAKGNIRNMLLDDANKIIKQMDDWTESQIKQDNNEDEEENAEDEESQKPSEKIYKRARELIQFLQE